MTCSTHLIHTAAVHRCLVHTDLSVQQVHLWLVHHWPHTHKSTMNCSYDQLFNTELSVCHSATSSSMNCCSVTSVWTVTMNCCCVYEVWTINYELLHALRSVWTSHLDVYLFTTDLMNCTLEINSSYDDLFTLTSYTQQQLNRCCCSGHWTSHHEHCCVYDSS